MKNREIKNNVVNDSLTPNSTNGFIKLNRNAGLFWILVKKRPSAFVLLSIIAQRARRYFDEKTKLEVGEAWLGDYEKYHSTRSKYRTDLKCLIGLGLITTRKHGRGTATKLTDSTIFNINPIEEINPVTINKNSERTIKTEIIKTMGLVGSPEINNTSSLLAIHKDNI